LSRSLLNLAVVAALVLPALAAATETWQFDPPHTSAQFSVRHMGISTVRGAFTKISGTVQYDPSDAAKSSIDVTIDATSVDTRVEMRDNHLKSPDFLDVAKYPTITFKSTRVEKAGENRLRVTGDLTLKGTTRSVVLEVTYSPMAVTGVRGETRRGFNGILQVNRKDFGLSYAQAVEAGPVVSDEITIIVDAEAVKSEELP